MSVIPSIFIGLGNPGKQYEFSPHNLGFMFIDALKQHLCSTETIFLTHQKIWSLPDKKIILSKPSTYVNLSGKALTEIYNRFYKNQVKPENFIRMVTIVHDDINIDMFDVRYRDGLVHPGAGGHNGLRDIIKASQNIGCDTKHAPGFHRIRLGCANKSSAPLYDYVTTRMNSDKIKKWDYLLERLVADQWNNISSVVCNV